ncbi:NADH-quinone oxidoreductase subunit N [Aggregatilinea lenta]|uniref:NADH-quinone oxidoreductase subunit N n=1 Tax=Aggregatilinea lenta TaxID=913108 RepID=UPI000E5AF5C4|nr:NADH-quinone oxidoreductase subunit N [Aggregatilinea lenta]
MFQVPDIGDLNVWATLPVLTLVIGACLLLVADLFIPQERKSITAGLAAVGIGLSLVLSLLSLTDVIDYSGSGPVMQGMFIADHFTDMVNVIALVTALLGVMVAYDYLQRTGIQRGEYYVLLLFVTSGVMFMGAAGDLTVIFIALELLSIPLYILSGFRRDQAQSEESAMKYFLLGAFASSFLVYGIALVYGATGTTSLQGIWQAVDQIVADSDNTRYLLLAGVGLVLVGLGFKVAAVPFHMWTPDVYQGAPTSVVAFMSVAAKVGGFAGLLRVLVGGVPNFMLEAGDAAAWQSTVWLLAILTMLLGNIVAIAQSDLKRLLAYSSIAHAGYILIAVAAAGLPGEGPEAVQAILIYLLAYTFTNVGAFAVVIAVEHNDATNTGLDAIRGLSRSRPALAAAMALFMFSLTGIPLTAGFMGKWFVFRSAISADLMGVALVGVLTSAVSAYYYLRIVWAMYFEEGESNASTPWPLAWAIGISAAGTLLIGVIPYLATEMAKGITLAFGG